MATPAAVLSVLVTANTSQATRGLVRFNTQLGATEGKANKALGAIKTMAKGAAIGTGVGLGYAVKKAADFEQQLDSLGSVSGATGRQMEQFRKQAMKAGADTKFSALDAAQAQTELAKGGLKVRQIMKGGLNAALALAAAGEMELGEAAATTANALNLFGLEGEKSMKVADALAKAANATTADVSDFAMALRQSGGVAKTAGLSFTETVLALEALANAGTKNSDAGTSLKTALLQLIGPTAKQAKLQKALGLEFINSEGSMKSMTQISRMLRGALGDMGDAQRAATLKVLAGTDGVRTLTALYDAGPEKLDRWRRGLDESGTAAEVAAQKQDNLKGKLENLQGSVETIAIAFGSKLLPTLTKAAEQITDILNDPNLTASEKLDRFAKMFSDAVADAAPVVAVAAGKVGLAAVRGFFNAFRESPLWLKLLTAAFLISKFGGFQAFRKVGMSAGGAMADGAATSFGGRMRSRVFGIGKGLLAGAMVAGIADGLTRADLSGGDRVQQALSTMTLGGIPQPRTISERLRGAMDQALRGGSVRHAGWDQFWKALENGLDDSGVRTIRKLRSIREQAIRVFGPDVTLSPRVTLNPDQALKAMTLLGNEWGRMRSGAIVDVRDMRRVTENQLGRIADTIGLNTKKGREAVRFNFKASADWIRRYMSDGEGLTRKGSREMERLLKVHSRQGKEGLKGNMEAIITVIAQTMRRGGKITDQGLGLIRRAWKQELKLYGLNPKEAIHQAEMEATRGVRGDRKQRGGPIDTGAPSGDTVPAVLERGEYVLNRKAVRKVGRKALDTLNFAAAPRFQGGGWVGASPAGLNPAIKSIGLWAMRKFGAAASSTLRPGDTDSFHGSGAAVDLTSGNMLAMARGIDAAFRPRLEELIHTPLGYSIDKGQQTAPFAQADHYDHVHAAAMGKALASMAKLKRVLVGGPDSALKSVVQGALDTTRRAAQRRLNALAGAMGGNIPHFRGDWVEVLEQIAKSKGWSTAAWKELVDRESGGDPTAVNPSSGAFGLGQFLGSTKDAYAKYGAASTNPVEQIHAMAKYIADRYGNPTAALAFHDANNWYAAGGPVGGGARKGSLLDPDRLSRSTGAVGGFGRVLKAFSGLKKKGYEPKKRSEMLRRLEKKLKDVGLPGKLATEIGDLSKNAEVFGDFASRASQLTVEPLEEGASPILGVVGGKTEAQWLADQLDALFRLRNKLIRAEEIIVERRKQIAEMVERARKALKLVAEQIRDAAKRKRELEKQLEQAKAHPDKVIDSLEKRLRVAKLRPKQNKELIKDLEKQLAHAKAFPDRDKERIQDLREKIKTITGQQGERERNRKVLKDRLIPALTGRQTALSTLRGETLTTIDEVQGAGSPMGRLTSLPVVGVLGGQIFDAQMRLRELAQPRETVRDTSADVSDRTAILEELLRQANLRTAVSERQFDVFKNMPPYGGQFALGGVVPGPIGAPRTVIAHGGEAIGQPGGISVVVNGDIVNVPRGKDPVEMVIGDRRFKAAVRNVRMARPLPGHGG